MKKHFYSEHEVNIIIRGIMAGVPEKDIAKTLNRTIGSLRMKMRSMGINHGKAVRNKLSNIEHSQALKELRKLASENSSDEKSQLITDRWETALRITGAKTKEIKGTKTYFINGVPMTVRKIMKLSGLFPELS